MAEDNPPREVIPVLTWEGTPYRVQIVDHLVMLYDLRDNSQMVKELSHEVCQELKRTKRPSRAKKLLEASFALQSTNLTPAERQANAVFDRVLKETMDVDKAEAAFDITLTLANAK